MWKALNLEEGLPEPALFKDKGFKHLFLDHLSISNTSIKGIHHFGMGPKCEGGITILFLQEGDSLNMTFGSAKKYKEVNDIYFNNVKKAIAMMKEFSLKMADYKEK